MRKFTFLIASLFIAIGAMAQTFVTPEVGKCYKIKGDHETLCWATSEMNGTSIKVSSNEADAAVFLRTANGFKVISTGKYLGMNGKVISYVDNENSVTIHNTGQQANNDAKYAIKVQDNWWYNNSTAENPITHESSGWITNIQRFWGFVEVAPVSREGWTVTASSQETSNESSPADKALDNDKGSFWCSQFSANYPHWIEFDMGKTHIIDYFDYVSRFDNTNSNGNILDYKLYVSDSPMKDNYSNAKEAASGTFVYGQGVNHVIKLNEPVAGRYVALVAETGTKGDWGGNIATTAANCAEFYIYGTVVLNGEAKAALLAAIKQAEAWLAERTIGNGVGEYSGGEFDNNALFESFLSGMNGYYDTINTSTPIDEIEEYTQLISGTIDSYTLNMPVAGKYYSFKNNNNYITSSVANGKIVCSTTKDPSVIYFFDGEHLLAYATGLYIGLNKSDWTFEAIGSQDISKIEFIAAINNDIAKYNIKSSDRWLHLSTDNGNYINRCENNIIEHSNQHNWIIEEVTTLPVTISSVGYATFYAPVAVTVPDGVTAHTLEVIGNWVVASEPLTTIPAYTGVILYSETSETSETPETYTFPVATEFNDEGVDRGVLTGTVAATYVKGEAYVLSALNDELGFYKAELNRDENGNKVENGTRFKNNSHKAYLQRPINGQSVASYTLSFDFDGTTAVEEVEAENEGVKVIYDLAGRKLDEITAPGVYIINGKKHIVR